MSVSDFDAFYEGVAPRLVRQVYLLTGDLGEAQDAVQEAFARAWQHWSTVREADSPEAWVRTVARRLAVSRWRRLRNSSEAWRRHGPPPDELPANPDHVAIVAALRQLPVAQRTAIVLHHVADLTVEQIAAETGAPTGTVKARLARGRAALAALLADGEELLDAGSGGVRP